MAVSVCRASCQPKDLPHEHFDAAFGLSKVKPEPCKLSTKSTRKPASSDCESGSMNTLTPADSTTASSGRGSASRPIRYLWPAQPPVSIMMRNPASVLPVRAMAFLTAEAASGVRTIMGLSAFEALAEYQEQRPCQVFALAIYY